MPDKKSASCLLVSATREIGDKAPDEIVLITPGEVVYTNQKPHQKVNYTPELLQKIAANFIRLAKDVVFDYEHQTLFGGEAPAAGWINGAFFDPGRGLVVKVKEWTGRAKEYIENKECVTSIALCALRFFLTIYHIRNTIYDNVLRRILRTPVRYPPKGEKNSS